MSSNEQIERELREAKNLKEMFDVICKHFDVDNSRPSFFVRSIIINYLWTAIKATGLKKKEYAE